MFKIGDRVKCVNSDISAGSLTRGVVYTIKKVSSDYVLVDQAPYTFHESRFELAETEKTPLDILKSMYEEAWRNGDSKLATYYEVLVEAFGVDVSVKAENYIFTYMPKKQG